MKSVVAALAGITLLAQQAPPQQPPTFRSGANLVRVDVTVARSPRSPGTTARRRSSRCESFPDYGT